MLVRSGLKKYSNLHRFKPNLMTGSRVMSISSSGGVSLIFGDPPGGPRLRTDLATNQPTNPLGASPWGSPRESPGGSPGICCPHSLVKVLVKVTREKGRGYLSFRHMDSPWLDQASEFFGYSETTTNIKRCFILAIQIVSYQ